MTEAVKEAPAEHGAGQGPKYFIDIEGTIHEWPSPTITTEQLAQLGGWDVSAGVIEIDRDNNERTLALGEVIELKPGHGFAKKVRWKRGNNAFEARLDLEMQLLQGHFGEAVARNGAWFQVNDYAVQCGEWNRKKTPVAFRAQVGYPGTPPYGIFVPAGIRFNGALPQNYQEPVGDRPPTTASGVPAPRRVKAPTFSTSPWDSRTASGREPDRGAHPHRRGRARPAAQASVAYAALRAGRLSVLPALGLGR